MATGTLILIPLLALLALARCAGGIFDSTPELDVIDETSAVLDVRIGPPGHERPAETTFVHVGCLPDTGPARRCIVSSTSKNGIRLIQPAVQGGGRVR